MISYRNPLAKGAAIRLGACAALLVAAGNARCGSASTTMNVSLIITAGCTIATAPLSFGTVQLLSAPVSATTTITPTCTNTTPYTVGIDQGAGSGATVTSRVMTGNTVSDTVTYTLYQDAGHSLVWGNTAGTNTVAGTGNGAAQTITVYGKLAAQSGIPDTYADVVNVTVSY